VDPDRDEDDAAVYNVNRLAARHMLAQLLGRSPSESEIENHVRDQPSFRTMDEIVSVVMRLSEREAGILRLRAGLTGEPIRSVAETASVYGVTRTRIDQIEKRLAAKLAAYSRAFVDPRESDEPTGSRGTLPDRED
jgi:Sigma-70, region 4